MTSTMKQRKKWYLWQHFVKHFGCETIGRLVLSLSVRQKIRNKIWYASWKGQETNEACQRNYCYLVTYLEQSVNRHLFMKISVKSSIHLRFKYVSCRIFWKYWFPKILLADFNCLIKCRKDRKSDIRCDLAK